MTDKPESKTDSPIPPTDPAPAPMTLAAVAGCPLCDAWRQWVGARVQSIGGFAQVPISPAELHDLLMVGYCIAVDEIARANEAHALCDHHAKTTEAIDAAFVARRKADAS